MERTKRIIHNLVSAVQIKAHGPRPSDSWQRTLRESETVRIGRVAGEGCSLPWDLLISREHADVCWRDGHLYVTCLPAAKNNISFQGQPSRNIRAALGECFRIGQTQFEVLEIEASPAEEPATAEPEFGVADDGAAAAHSYSEQELKRIAFGNAPRQLELLADLPRLISTSQSDEALGRVLSELLLEALPQAEAVAVASFDEAELPPSDSDLENFPKPRALCVATREGYAGRFLPSRRLILRTLREQASSLHIWDAEGSSERFTVCDDLGWALCAPVRGEACRGWCLYVAGRGTVAGGLVLTEQDLVGDLRFTELVAQFIGSVRQVRLLQEQRTQLSTFFSPKVIESITQRESDSTLMPAERDITVLFCDLRGFSRMSEALQGDLHRLLNSVSRALGLMVNGILQSDGAIADFQGDAALGFWGWPVKVAEGPAPACLAALAIHREFRRTIGEAGSLLDGLSVGIGISHGRALAGRIGTDQQSKVGVFGPVVNQGSRLEGLSKQFGVPICIDEATAAYAKLTLPPEAGRCRRLASVRPAGMDSPLTVSALLPPEEEYPDTTDEMIVQYEQALEEVIAGRWTDASAQLRGLSAADLPSQFLLKLMARSGDEPPPGWDGVFSLDRK